MKNRIVIYAISICTLLFLNNILFSQTSIDDELNGSTLGNATGITYTNTPNGQGAVFSRTSESRIEYPFSMGLPHEGTIEMVIKITKAYHYGNYTLWDNRSEAFIFNTGPSDVWYLGAMWLTGDTITGEITLTTALTSEPTAHTLTTAGANFKFNEWHVISFSYGSQGQYINIDGQLVASNPSYTETLQACGNWGSTRVEPTIGEVRSVVWGNNQYDQGFEGTLDRFRASATQQDWMLNNTTNKISSISGRIFQDYNATGVFDAGDSIISCGWQINLQGPVNRITTTNVSGYYSFDNLPSGTYQVSQNVPPEWTVLIPSWSGIDSIILEEGENLTNIDFADFNLKRYNSDIEYLHFPNGQRIGKNDERVGSETAPQQSGLLSLDDLPINSIHLIVGSLGFHPDTFYVKKDYVVQLAISSNDNSVHVFAFDDPKLSAIAVLVGPGQTKIITFKTYNVENDEVLRFRCDSPGHSERGEFGYLIIKSQLPSSASISGRIFQDYNASGVFDAGDSIISNGWQVNIQGTVSWTTVTDELGYYTFDNLPAGTYTISQNVPESWTVLVPLWSGVHSLTLSEGQELSNVDFADFNLQRHNSNVEYIQFPNGLNLVDNALGPSKAPNNQIINIDQALIHSVKINYTELGFSPDTFYVNPNYVVPLVLSNHSASSVVIQFTDQELRSVMMSVRPDETRIMTFKTYSLNRGEAYPFIDDFLRNNSGQMIINCSSPCFLLTAPTKNATITSDTIRFEWDEVQGAIRYELCVDNNMGLGSPEISKQHIPALENLTANHYTISGNWLTDTVYHWKVFAFTPTDTLESSIGTFTYEPLPKPLPDWVPFYRAFNPVEVDHFYCSSVAHLDTAIQSNFRFEGVEGYVSLHPFEVSPPNQLLPIYRFYQDTSIIKMRCHYYTTSDSDRDDRISEGWIYEGISGYGLSLPDEGLTSLHHTYLNVPGNRRDNFYTVSEIEKNNSISLFGYSNIGAICYVSATGNNSTLPWHAGSIEVGAGINPLNGNLGHYTTIIFSIPEGKVGLDFSHFYNSMAVRLFRNSNPIGNGWNHNYNISLTENDSNIFVVWPDEINVFDDSTLESKTPGIYDILSKIDTAKYQIRKKDQTVFTFEKLGNVSNTNNTFLITSITDRYNNQIDFNYNNQGWLKWVKSPANRYISFSYYPESDDARYGLIHYVKDSLALNRSVEYIYDNQRNLIQFIDAKGQTTRYSYEGSNPFDHFLDTVTYADGTKIINTYDQATKRLTSQNFVSNQTEKRTNVSIPTANRVTIADENNKWLTMVSDRIGNITDLITPKGEAKFIFTDSLMNPTKPTEIIDGKGYVTHVEYNSKGDPLTIHKPDGITHQYQWNGSNDLTKYTNPLNNETNFIYTGGYLTSIVTTRGTTNITYFSNGNISTVNDPLSQTITYTYNTYNNVETISDILGNTTRYLYDGASRLTRLTDANNHSTIYHYDPNNLLESTENALSKITQYTYDGANRLTSVMDARGNSSSMTFNQFSGQLDYQTDQLGNQTSYKYFDNGLLKSITNRESQTINYGYDTINRITSLTGPSINRLFFYDNNDNIDTITDTNGNLFFAYDSLNRLTSYTDFYGNQVQYEYDKASNIKKIIYPEIGKDVEYEYYPDNLLQTVKDWDDRITTYVYRDDGKIRQVNLPNGTYTQYTYDTAGRLTRMANKKSDGTEINSYIYTLDGVGNHTGVTVNEPLESPPLVATNISYSYNRANRIEHAGTETFDHDLNGNLTSQNNNGVITSFAFDAENKLVNVGGTLNATYTYDAMGFRRVAIRNGLAARYVLDINGSMENVLMETDGDNNALYYYIQGNGLLYRIKASDNSVEYYHFDSRGSAIAITDQAQTITHKYVYDAFGKVLKSEEPVSAFNPFRYVGKYGVMYEDSSLYFMRARYYNPDIGRFLSEDPVFGLILFSYCNNNPIIKLDPEGLSEINYDEWGKYRKQILLRNLLYYQQESAKYEQREMKLARWVIAAEGIEKISAFGFSAAGGGPALGLAQASIKSVYGMFTNNKEMVLGSGIDLITGVASYVVSTGTSGLIKNSLNESQGTINATKMYTGFGASSGFRTIKSRIIE